MIVSGEQQRDPAIHKHVSILPQTPLRSRLPQNIEQSSLCYTVGPCWLSTLNTAACTCPSQTPLNSGEKTALVARWPLGPFTAGLRVVATVPSSGQTLSTLCLPHLPSKGAPRVQDLRVVLISQSLCLSNPLPQSTRDLNPII